MPINQTLEKSHKALVKKLVLLTLAMFAFGFALVPLYDVFCDITGLNGKTANEAVQSTPQKVDDSRLIKVEFITRKAQGIPWVFTPHKSHIFVHPGQFNAMAFLAKNQAKSHIIAQAIPSVSPGKAAQYFQKIECFCFNQQPLNANEEVDMSLQFYVDNELPQDISTITLSYTLYDITDKVDKVAENLSATYFVKE